MTVPLRLTLKFMTADLLLVKNLSGVQSVLALNASPLADPTVLGIRVVSVLLIAIEGVLAGDVEVLADLELLLYVDRVSVLVSIIMVTWLSPRNDTNLFNSKIRFLSRYTLSSKHWSR